MRSKGGFVYILTNKPRGTLYIGVTSDMESRLTEHRAGSLGSFASRYNLHRLVHLEPFDDIETAIAREKQLKRWRREWKVNLVEEAYPDWRDLAGDWTGEEDSL